MNCQTRIMTGLLFESVVETNRTTTTKYAQKERKKQTKTPNRQPIKNNILLDQFYKALFALDSHAKHYEYL